MDAEGKELLATLFQTKLNFRCDTLHSIRNTLKLSSKLLFIHVYLVLTFSASPIVNLINNTYNLIVCDGDQGFHHPVLDFLHLKNHAKVNFTDENRFTEPTSEVKNETNLDLETDRYAKSFSVS